jgi:hypothetical protein
MNKYQKIALLVGIILLFLILGKTITKIGFIALASLGTLLWKFIIIIVATLLIISFLKKGGKKN